MKPKRSLPYLKREGAYTDLRAKVRAEKVTVARIKLEFKVRGNSVKKRLALISKTKRQKIHLEKIWKILARQAQNKANIKNKEDIINAMKTIEESIVQTDQFIAQQKYALKKELSKSLKKKE
jgi:hypothetical protein